MTHKWWETPPHEAGHASRPVDEDRWTVEEDHPGHQTCHTIEIQQHI